ncbi:hypothetical protein [Actinotalea sp.]|uniref:hypothetical protein n=1 Tax=Actinotalea sp. TaxID=1872145 RepID=UPI003566D6EB
MAVDTWMHFDPRGDLLDATRECEAEIFLRWYGNTRAQLEDEYGPYEDATRFICLTDSAGEVVAVMRLLAPGGVAGLKTLADLQRSPWNVDGARSAAAAGLDLRSTWDVATIGTRRSSAGSGVRYSLALYRGLLMATRANRITAITAILDERVRRLLESSGLAMWTLPGARAAEYLGSPSSTPIYGDTAKLVDNQRRNAPEAYSLVTIGQGMDGFAIPPMEAFRLDVNERLTTAEVPVTLAGIS